MKKMTETINERKKEINELCMELRWVYRGYFTSLYDYLTRRQFLNTLEQFVDQLVAYDEELGEKEKKLYKDFLVSSIIFLKKYCRSADMIFLSVYKIALVVEQSWQNGVEFDGSIYRYMFEPHENDEDISRDYIMLKKAISSFGEMYNDPEIDKKDFPYHITVMIDCLLFETGQSYLLDHNYDDGLDKLKQQIGAAKYHLQRSLREENKNEQ